MFHPSAASWALFKGRFWHSTYFRKCYVIDHCDHPEQLYARRTCGTHAICVIVFLFFFLTECHAFTGDREGVLHADLRETFIFILHEQYIPSILWLAASHLASGCYETWKPAFLQDVTFTKRRQKDSNAVPVQAVQVSVVYNCKMW